MKKTIHKSSIVPKQLNIQSQTKWFDELNYLKKKKKANK